jgi:hypothetical protein
MPFEVMCSRGLVNRMGLLQAFFLLRVLAQVCVILFNDLQFILGHIFHIHEAVTGVLVRRHELVQL